MSAGGEVIYEVNLDVDAGIEADYRAWLRGHVAQMLALPGFLDSRMADVLDPPPAPGDIERDRSADPATGTGD